MRKEFIRYKNNGFGLVEIMVAAGLIGGLSLVVMNLTKTGHRSVRNIETKSEVTAILGDMRTILANPTNCFETFKFDVNAKDSSNSAYHLMYTNNLGTLVEKFKNDTQAP